MSKNLNIIFSENLRRLLAEHDKTQADLYRYMGVSSAIASAWCAGKKIPRGDKLQKMCVWFNCDLSDLLEEKPVEVIKPSRYSSNFPNLLNISAKSGFFFARKCGNVASL